MEYVYQAPDIRLISGETKRETGEWSLCLVRPNGSSSKASLFPGSSGEKSMNIVISGLVEDAEIPLFWSSSALKRTGDKGSRIYTTLYTEYRSYMYMVPKWEVDNIRWCDYARTAIESVTNIKAFLDSWY